MRGKRSLAAILLASVAVSSALQTMAETNEVDSFTLAQAQPGESGTEPAMEPVADDEAPEARLPIGFGLSYGLYSDYIFRGVNFSEFDGEGRELPNHQLTVSLSFDLNALELGDLGTVGFDTWFEWYAGQKDLDPDRGGQNLQEVDYTIWWSHPVEPIATDLTLGYTFYEFVNLAHTLRQDDARGNNNDDRTHEYFVLLEHNDAWMWQGLWPDNEAGVLNPSFFLAHDVGALSGVWMELGVSHAFPVPGVEHLTVTPGYQLDMQCDYWKDGFFIAGDEWSLVTEYDLTELLHLPPWAGTLSVAGELYFFNAYGNFEGPDTNGQIRGQDEFWGGMSVNWSR